MKTYICYIYDKPKAIKIKATSKEEAERKAREQVGDRVKIEVVRVWW